MWQPHEQKNRPKNSTEIAATAMKMKPAVRIPNSKVYITSFSSSGASVLPLSFQCAMCRPISR